MITVPLQAIPNQTFSIQIDDNIFSFVLKFIINFMIVDLSINNVPILTGLRLVPQYPVVPYKYLENGNFILITANNDYPNYTQFGITQFLVYATQDELEDIRAANR
jgi:hypothetical protein